MSEDTPIVSRPGYGRYGQLQPGDRLGAYQLLAPIAQGGMGQIWAARPWGKLGVPLVAVKVALMEHAYQHDKVRELFFDEGRLATLVDHPNVCKTYELGETNGALFLVMELIDGVSLLTLQKSLRAPRRFAPHLAAYVVAQACAGLHAAHELRDDAGVPLEVVHRDATPQNILVTAQGDVKVVDFGVAKARNQLHATATGEIKGKLNYLAPEQALGSQVDRRTDVFALGCVLYFLTTGERAFHADSAAGIMLRILEHRYEAPTALVPAYPPELAWIVERALAHEPNARFASAEEMRLALDELVIRPHGASVRDELAGLVTREFATGLDVRRRELRAALRRIDLAMLARVRAAAFVG